MKQKVLSPLMLLLASLIIAIGFTSCDDDEPYYAEDFLTSYNWELVAINGYSVNELNFCEFKFYNFGNGIYGSYNSYGNWNEIPIQWETAYAAGGAQYLYVYPAGSGETWEYMMRCYGGYPAQLELTDLFTGDRLTFQAY